jgi:HAD superfamily hydrolase (TIGR01509 family)
LTVVEAVLFDWGNTLVQFTWDDELLATGHRAGLAALGREDEADEFTARFRREVLPGLTTRVDYGDAIRGLLGSISDDAVDRFVDAEHDAWQPAHALLGAAHALLDALRERGLKTGIVANAWPEPGRVLRRDLEELGVAERVAVAVFSTDVGVRKPAPEIFLHALDELGVDPLDAMFVGDRLIDDVQGAAAVGMTTVQAMWFEADDTPVAVEPDFLAFTPMDVLNAARRLGA